MLGDSKESEEAVTVRLRDSGGYINTPLRFYLEKGSHTVGLTPVSGSAAVRELVLAGAEDIPNYEEYKNKNSAAHVKDFLQTAEAENYSAKSNSDILCVNDRTSAATSPQDPSEIRLNTVGGTSWSTNRQMDRMGNNRSRNGGVPHRIKIQAKLPQRNVGKPQTAH